MVSRIHALIIGFLAAAASSSIFVWAVSPKKFEADTTVIVQADGDVVTEISPSENSVAPEHHEAIVRQLFPLEAKYEEPLPRLLPKEDTSAVVTADGDVVMELSSSEKAVSSEQGAILRQPVTMEFQDEDDDAGIVRPADSEGATEEDKLLGRASKEMAEHNDNMHGSFASRIRALLSKHHTVDAAAVGKDSDSCRRLQDKTVCENDTLCYWSASSDRRRAYQDSRRRHCRANL